MSGFKTDFFRGLTNQNNWHTFSNPSSSRAAAQPNPPVECTLCDNNTRKKTTPGCQSNFLCPNIFPSTVTSSSLSRHVHFRLIKNKWLLHALWCNTISCISHDIIYCTSLFNGKMSLRIFRAAGDGKITEGVKHTLYDSYLHVFPITAKHLILPSLCTLFLLSFS